MSDTSRAVGENSPELIEALKNAASVAEMTEIRRAWLVEQEFIAAQPQLL